jgi:hypothetical protein
MPVFGLSLSKIISENIMPFAMLPDKPFPPSRLLLLVAKTSTTFAPSAAEFGSDLPENAGVNSNYMRAKVSSWDISNTP